MIAVFLEIRDGKIKKSSLEALSEAGRRAGELGVPASAILAGAAVADLAPAAFAAGAAKVYVIEDPGLAAYSSQAYAAALAGFAETGEAARPLLRGHGHGPRTWRPAWRPASARPWPPIAPRSRRRTGRSSSPGRSTPERPSCP